jgi:SAM-dependent methyltransferase
MTFKDTIEAQPDCNQAAGTGDGKQIRTAPHPKCILCGCEGRLLHSNQSDRLFGAAGSWNFKICPNRKCGLVWLDPMPLGEEIGKAYANYYTHAPHKTDGSVGLRKKIRGLMQCGYWAKKYNYEIGPRPSLARSLGKLLYLSPIHRREVDAGVRCLAAVPQGRLLDVGCGGGEWLLTMRERGWSVEGCDFDKHAVEVARQRGLKVKCGSLEEQNYPDNSFDAVTLSHVIEHVPDPVRVLGECARILKPGGKLVLFTPNQASLGHWVFGEAWRGLEPPRHLHLFSIKSLRRMLGLAGFQSISVVPFIVTSVVYESILLRRGRGDFSKGIPRSWTARGLTSLFKFVELWLLPWNPSVGDCLIAVAVKRPEPCSLGS